MYLLIKFNISTYIEAHNGRSTRGFVVEAQPE